MTSIKFNFSQKCSDFGKLLRKTSKIGKLPITLATLNFLELIVVRFGLKSSLFEKKCLFFERIHQKKKTKFIAKISPISSCEIGLGNASMNYVFVEKYKFRNFAALSCGKF